MDDLRGKNAIVTGASQGLGLEIARWYLRAGISGLALCARNETDLAGAVEELAGMAGPGQTVFGRRCDVSSPEETAAFADEAIARFGRIHILVNNAAVYGPKGRIEDVDWEEWVRALAINIGGSVLMCRRLLPHFRQHGGGKIIQLSGGGATSPMPFQSAYGASKAAIVRFAESLALEAADDGVEVNCIAPGLLDTRLLDEVLAAGPERVGKAFFDRMAAAKASGKTTPLALGAQLAVFLASDASHGVSGRLISAQWDKYRDWPAHAEELSGTDVYTLRRIVGRDRGMEWGDR